MVRQLALHCNLAAQIQKSLGSGREPYSSNWLERLRQIKRIRFVFASPPGLPLVTPFNQPND